MSLPGDWTAGNTTTHTHTQRRLQKDHMHKLLCVCVCVLGHVGPPLPCNYVKLIDVAEMSYYAAEGEGEVSHRCVSLLKPDPRN